MKSSTKIILIVSLCLILVGALLIAAAAYKTPGGFSGLLPALVNNASNIGRRVGSDGGAMDLDSAYSPDNRYGIDESVRSINIDWASGTVKVVCSGSEKRISFSESGYREITEDSSLRYGVRDGVLYIQDYHKGWVQDAFAKDLIVTVPDTEYLGMLFPELDEVRVDAASADVSIDGNLNLDKLRIGTASGEIYVRNADKIGSTPFIMAKEIYAGTASGNVELACAASDAEVNTASGNVRLSGSLMNVRVGTASGDVDADLYENNELDISTTSGEVSVRGASKKAMIGTTSGEVSVRDGGISALGIDTTSGDVSLYLNENRGADLGYDTVSGDMNYPGIALRSENGRFLYGDALLNANIKTVSGDLELGILAE